MQKERNIDNEKLFELIKYIEKNNIETAEILRMKKSKKNGETIHIKYYNYLDVYIVKDKYFTRQLHAIDYFNKL